MIYDGEKFSYAALGDAYPEQIRFATFATGDYDSKDIAEKDSSSLIPGIDAFLPLSKKCASVLIAFQ